MMPLVDNIAWRRLLMALCAIALCSTPTLGFSVPVVHSGANLRLQGKGVGVSAVRRARVSAAAPHSMQLFPMEGMGFKWPGSDKKGGNEDRYHASREQYHEERIKYHQERLKHHREARLSRKGGSKAAPSGKPGKTQNIVFVDLSNTCRSAAAEGMFRSILTKQGRQFDYGVASRSTGGGTTDWFKPEVARYIEQESTDPRMTSAAIKRGVTLSGIKSTLMSREDVAAYDLIICMDEKNKRDLLQAAEYWGVKDGAKRKLRSMTSYCRGTQSTEVPDPYYGGGQGPTGQVFERVLDLLEDGCVGLLRDLDESLV